LFETGITQEQIDEMRLTAENLMLADLQNILNDRGSLEFRGKSGETPVTRYFHINITLTY